MPSKDKPLPDIAQSLEQLGETTTAAELVRTKGQSKKVRIISEKKLMDWIMALLKQHMAGKEDAFSDAEKEELLKKTQDELARRIKREQDAEAERAKIQRELDKAVGVLSNEQSSRSELDQAMAALKAKLVETEQINQDLQQDNYDLHDRLNEKMAMLSTTIAEKEKLRVTVRNQMLRSNALVEGVLGLDNQYYGTRHQEENPVPEDIDEENQFYHDYDIGAAVISTLSGDLERLRAITKDRKATQEKDDSSANLLASDLELLEQLKAGSLRAMDVAQPVAGLTEAVEGARNEAELLERSANEALGVSSGHEKSLTAVPDASGDPAEVLAGTTTVVRELAAALARSRQRLNALKQMADEADEARSDTENELEEVRAAYDRVLGLLAQRAVAEHLPDAEPLVNTQTPPAARGDAAAKVIEQLQGGGGGDAAVAERFARIDRLLTDEVKPAAKPTAAKDDDQASLLARLDATTVALEQLVQEKRKEAVRLTAQADQARQRIAAQERELAEVRGQQAAAQALIDSRKRTERDMAGALVRAAKNDPDLADATADLALALENSGPGAPGEDLSLPLRDALNTLARRKQDLTDEAESLRAELKAVSAQTQEASSRSSTIHAEREKLSASLAQAQHRVQELERDFGRAKGDAELLRTQVQEANARRTELEAERGKLQTQVGHAERRLHELEDTLLQARKAITTTQARAKAGSQAERQIANELIRAAQNDPDLADVTADLALTLEEAAASSGDEAVSINQQVVATVTELVKRKRALGDEARRLAGEVETLRNLLKEAAEQTATLQGERDEIALSGKEVIEKLTQQRDSRTQELETLRQEQTELTTQLARFQSRAAAAETGNRQLAEALAALAAAEKSQDGSPVLEDQRVDLELALSQLPSEGESGVEIPQELTMQLADCGRKLAEALVVRRQAASGSLSKAHEDQAALKAKLERHRQEVVAAQAAFDEQSAALRSSQAELAAVRQELERLGKDSAVKVQELTSARGELASLKAELSVATQRLDEQERRFQTVNEQLAQTRGEDEQVTERYQQALARSEAAEHAQVQLVRSLRSLTNRQDASPALARALTDADSADPLSKAGQKLDLAQSAGPEQVALAGQAYVQALRDRVQTMAEKLEVAHGQLTGTKDSEDRLHGELAAIRAAVVDRDHQLENLNAVVEKTKEDHASLLSQMMDQQRAHDANLAALKQVQEQLRLAQAELEDYHARDAASSGHFSSDNEALRKEMEKERDLREAMENQLSELRQQIEADEARLKSQREEFTHRLEERDQVIHQKDRQLDHLAAQRTDTKSLEAQVQAVSRELANANDRIKELEGAYGENAGVAVRSGDLARELKNLQAERDQLREQHRQFEGDLADAVSLNAQLKTQLEEKRKDQAGLREKMTKELGEERDKSSAMRDEFRKLKEEVVGLRARIRRLTDSGQSSGPPPKTPKKG